ncbi:MAG: MBOAT family protein [Candidatus Omnitrophica bacterium]|nr:MBOAT family protein [Candidatus Omnitrophota bacterium]
MNFNSISFLIFILIFSSIYIYLKGKSRLYFILISSYFFYGWWDYRYLSLIVLSTSIDYFAGLQICKEKIESRRKVFLCISIGANLLILFIFKYYNFFAFGFTKVLNALGFHANHSTLDVLLPIGISFYTFQSMSYTIDVYRKKISCEKDYVVFATYVAFFPQLVAGPIERASSLLPQFRPLKNPSRIQVREGCSLIIWGYFLKVFIADNLSRIADHYFFGVDLKLSSFEVLVGVLAFTVQIYGDFAGYSKIARGISKLMGIELMQNFNHPYFARNPPDFWRRWHISLSTWLRDYLYISLGGNRKGLILTIRNLMITMLLGGLWHGASWVFVIWGFYHGMLLIGHRLLSKTFARLIKPNIFTKRCSQLVMFALTVYSWLIFRSTNLEHFFYLQKCLFSPVFFPSEKNEFGRLLIYAFWTIVFGFVIFLADSRQEKNNSEDMFLFYKCEDYVLTAIIILLLIMFGGRSNAFIYFQF